MYVKRAGALILYKNNIKHSIDIDKPELSSYSVNPL